MAIGWALHGPGRHAARNVVPEMKKAADTRLVAVISRDRVRGEAFAKAHGFERAYASLEEALCNADVNAIYDATPDGLHAGNIAAAAAARRHTLVEKPLALSLEQGRKAIEACSRAGVSLGVVFNQRHEPVHLEARRRVLAGDIGEVVLARVEVPLRVASSSPPPAGGNWRQDRSMRSGGLLMSIGDHAFDTLAWITGQRIDEVSALVDAPGRVERTAAMTLRLSNGALGYASTTNRTPYARIPFEIHGTKGSLTLRNTYTYLTGAAGDARPSLEQSGESGVTVGSFDRGECFRMEIERFNRAIRGEAQPMTSAAEGLRTLAIIDALYESASSGRTVKVVTP